MCTHEHLQTFQASITLLCKLLQMIQQIVVVVLSVSMLAIAHASIHVKILMLLLYRGFYLQGPNFCKICEVFTSLQILILKQLLLIFI